MNQFTPFSQAPFHLWGILNCTPDSFYDGSGEGANKRIEKALTMVKEGASVIDIGGESTRPGAEAVSPEEEINRVLPVIKGVRQFSDVSISIDTSKASVARAALNSGANIVNDVTAGADSNMSSVVSEFNATVVLMHMKGTPRTMQKNPEYSSVVDEVKNHLLERRAHFVEADVPVEKIFFDPGIGFGKSLEHNLSLIAEIGALQQEAPVLLGTSRKSFISGVDVDANGPEERLPGSLASVAVALKSGVTHFRVHDVAATRQFILIIQRLLEKTP